MNGMNSIGQTDLLDALAGTRQVRLSDGHTVSLAAPVILDLDGKGVQTLSRNTSGVRYDLDGDGLADSTSWIGSTEGFLFLDRDGNGTVTNAGEFSFLGDVPGATSDLQGLRAFDSTKDGILSSTDARWGDFRIWQDKNGNGVAETSEILTLATAGVRSLNLSAADYAGANASGDVVIVAKGSYTRTTGATMDLVDAALTYVSAPRDGLPTIDFVAQTQSRKAGKYRISVKDGRLAVAPKHGNDTSDVRAGGLSGAVELTFKHSTVGMLSAIVLDLDGDGLSLKGVGKSRNWFDMNGDGSPDRQGWAGRKDGFLVIDRDGDGRIGSGAELSFLAEDPTAGSSLAGLAKLDSNGDKVIDKTDARFGELRVWADSNGNGATDGGELKTLADLGIQSLSIDGRATGDRSKPGDNLLMATATFTYANGMKRTLGDAALAFRPSQPMPADAVEGQRSALAAEASPTALAAETSPSNVLGGGQTVPLQSSLEYPSLDGAPSAASLSPLSTSSTDAATNQASGTNAVARHALLRDMTSLPAVVPFPSPEPFSDYGSPTDASPFYGAASVQASGTEIAPWLAASSEHFAAALTMFGNELGTGQLSSDLSRSSQSVLADMTLAYGSTT